MIGARRWRVEILQAGRTPEAGGGASLVWTPVASEWAQVERLASTPDFLGDRRRRLKRVAVTLRERAAVSIGDRVRFGAETYDVVSIESEDGRTALVTAEEATDAGAGA
ncbi:MAG: head-tail adaptor protein [Pseudomonadota bacterium]